MSTVDVVAFPFHDWRKSGREGVRTRDGHVLEYLEQDPRIGRVLVVDRPVPLLERFRHPRGAVRARGERISERRFGTWFAAVTQVGTKVSVLDVAVPDTFRVARSPRAWWFHIFRQPRMARCVDWAARAAQVRTHAVIAWTPTAAPLILQIAPTRLVFDSLDNWLIHPQLRRQSRQARDAYRALLPRADHVVVAAPASARALRPWAPMPIVIPNGVDPQRFAGDERRPDDLPGGLVVGYAGKLADRIDVEFCLEVVEGVGDASFVFVGPIMDPGVRRLARRTNVRLLGDRSPDRLPAYVRHFDVAWIPHHVGEGETGGDPIKLYEYWAAGRQVVSTAIDGSDAWRKQAWIVADAPEAITVLRGLLSGELAPKPVAVATERTWASISARLVDLLVGEPGCEDAVRRVADT